MKNLLKRRKEVKEQMLGDKLDKTGTVAIMKNYLGDFQELEDQTMSMMEKTSRKNPRGQPFYICKVCGKEDINGNLKTHIEANHLEGVSIPCNNCEKTFRCKKSLGTHIRRNHNGN